MADAALALAVLVVELVQAITVTASDVNDDVIELDQPWHWAIVCAGPAAVIVRRTRPFVALFIGTIATMAAWSVDLPVAGLAGMVILYSVMLYGPQPLAFRACLTSASFLFLFTCLGLAVGEAPLFVIPLVAWTVATPIMVASNINTSRALLASTEARLTIAEERRLADTQKTIQDERNRVARELHDVVAHGLSLIVVQSGAGTRILDKSSDQDLQVTHSKVGNVLTNIETAARQSLGEMRQILGVLRHDDDEEPWRPTPGALTVTELVAQASESGLDVSFETIGEPRELPTAVGAATYRVVQEALTNVRKHGGPRVKASVTGTFSPSQLSIVIEDNGRGAAAAHSGGHGLIGMRERTELLGGSFKAGPRVGGGFRVHVQFPTDESAS